MLSCGGKSGQLDLSLSLDSGVNSSLIEEFIFVVSPTGGSTKVLYPSTCVSCATSQDPCPQAQVCIKDTVCGFSKSQNDFLPELKFSDFGQGSSIEVIACALDSSKAVQASGSVSMNNTDGQSASISMTASDPSCLNELPAVCP